MNGIVRHGMNNGGQWEEHRGGGDACLADAFPAELHIHLLY